jgi:hypothetical protein
VQPSRAIRNLEHLQLKDSTILTAICGLSDVKAQLQALAPGAGGLPREVAAMRVITDYTQGLGGLCGAFLQRAQAHLLSIAKSPDLFITRPHIVRPL